MATSQEKIGELEALATAVTEGKDVTGQLYAFFEGHPQNKELVDAMMEWAGLSGGKHIRTMARPALLSAGRTWAYTKDEEAVTAIKMTYSTMQPPVAEHAAWAIEATAIYTQDKEAVRSVIRLFEPYWARCFFEEGDAIKVARAISEVCIWTRDAKAVQATADLLARYNHPPARSFWKSLRRPGVRRVAHQIAKTAHTTKDTLAVINTILEYEKKLG